MTAGIVRFTPKREREKRQGAALAIEQLDLLPADAMSSAARAEVRAALQRVAEPPGEKPVWQGGFAMISRDQTAYVWDRIRALPPQARPHQVRHAFDLVLLNLRHDTGEVLLTRAEFAEKIGCSADKVSEIMSTLEGIGAIKRERRRTEGMRGPGRVVFFINPHVGWAGSLAARAELASEMPPPGPLLRVMEGGKA